MYKQITLTLILMLVMLGSIYAKGQDDSQIYPMPGGPGYNWSSDDLESIEMVGTLELINGNPPFLISGTDKYLLMVPYHLLYNLDIENGEEISVTGYETSGHMWQWDDSEKALILTAATIKGEEYNLSQCGGYMHGSRGFGRYGRGGRGCW
jgi:hypothetical protein